MMAKSRRRVNVRRHARPVDRTGLFAAMYGGQPARQTPPQEQVFEGIRRERMLQDHLFGEQDERTVGDYILIAQEYLDRAKHFYVDNPLQDAIDSKVPMRLNTPRRQKPTTLLRKVAAIIVKCLEQHGV